MANTELKIENLCLSFGGLEALSGIDIDIKGPGVFSIIGPNGAGKTSILNCINGFYRPNKGRIVFNGKDITSMPSYNIAKLGISRAFQNLALYSGMSVLDNILAGRNMLTKYGLLSSLLYFGKARKEEVKNRAAVENIIKFLEIQSIRHEMVGILSYGLRKKVELARALALEPAILLLDEPMAGMNNEEKEDIARFIIDICEQREIPIILVEHDMGVVMDISDRVIVLDFGNKIAEGSPEEITANPAVINAYLGTQEELNVKS